MDTKSNLFRSASLAVLIAVTSSTVPMQAFASEPVETKLYSTANSQLYQAQQLLNVRDGGDKAYELLRDLLKNDDSINEVSRKKIQMAANSIENYRDGNFLTRLLNTKRFKERPYLKARHLLAEAIMDSRVALNESSDSEILFVEKLLKNYFYPGHADKVEIHYPSTSEFAFKTWAYTKENMYRAKVGESTESFDGNTQSYSPSSAGMGMNQPDILGLPEVGNTPEDEEAWLEFMEGLATSAAELAQIKSEYGQIQHRVMNRYLYQSMLMQAIAEPGSAIVDPQLQEFLKSVRIEINLGDTAEITEEEVKAYKDQLGEGIVDSSDDELSINLSKLYQLDRPGSISNLSLQVKKQKDEGDRTSLSVISSVSGEDLMFIRLMQVVAVGLKDGREMRTSKAGVFTISVIDKIFDTLASWSSSIRGSQPASASLAGKAINALRALGGGIFKIPQKVFDSIASLGQSKIGKKVLDKINSNKTIQNGNLMKGLVALGVIAEVTTAAIEYQYIETRKERLDHISETSTRVAATMTYLVPVVGQVAAVVDLSHMVMGTGLETADFYRGIVTLSKYATLAYYGESPTTIALSKLEVFYNLPRNNVYLERHGGWIENKEDAEARQVDLFLEMEEITRNNLILLYRAHRSLDRGANNDFGERIYVYSNQYESNLEMMHQTEQEILKELEKYQD